LFCPFFRAKDLIYAGENEHFDSQAAGEFVWFNAEWVPGISRGSAIVAERGKIEAP